MTTSEATTMRRISNSEVTAWLQCQAKYRYQYDLNLVPNNQSTALSRGILGHDILAEYYEMRMKGHGHNESVVWARSVLMKHLSTSPYSMEIVTEVDRILAGYWGYYKGDDDWIILAVEKQYDLPLTADFEFSMRLDLLVRSRSTGDVILVDHKFIYDFWSTDDIELSPQFPKYMGALRANGMVVDKAILNQIRYRKLKDPGPDDLFRRTAYKPSAAKLTNVLREQIIASRQISEFRALPADVRKDTALRALNKMTCKGCPVAQLCLSELDGGDITYTIQNDYTQNTRYGYNSEATASLTEGL